MLVITRKEGQAIILDDDIRIEVIKIQNGRVRLAIQAPRSVPVWREELNDCLDIGGVTIEVDVTPHDEVAS